MAQRGRAYRRHQDERAKRRTYNFIRWCWHVPNPKQRLVGRLAAVHRKACSQAWCCGNRRTMEGDTWQEIHAAISATEQQEELAPPPTARTSAF
jgi:hypothetical protein